MNIKLLDQDEFSWLKNSDFYNSLDLEDPDGIINIIYVSKFTDDVFKFLEVIDLWGVNFRPPEFFDLVLKENPIKKIEELYEITHSEFYKFLLFVLQDDEKFCNLSAKEGFLDALTYAHKNKFSWNVHTSYYAALGGNLECLKYLHENGCPWNKMTCASVAESGHLKCLKYVHKNGCSWNKYTCEYAAKNGHLKCLKYAHENRCPINIEECLKIAKGECKEYLEKIGK